MAKVSTRNIAYPHFYIHFLCRPGIFKSTIIDDSKESMKRSTSQQEDEIYSREDDGPHPLEANMNRMRPFELQPDADSESSSDTDA